MEQLEQRVYRVKTIRDKLKWDFKPTNECESELEQRREKAILIEYKNKLTGDFHAIETFACAKRQPTIGSLSDFLMPFSFRTIKRATITKNGRKWATDHLTGKSLKVINEFMDFAGKHNKTEKDETKRYDWDIVSLINGRERVKNAFILRVRLSSTNGLFIGIIDGDWHIFY
jgi:hypothetical protein